MTIAAIPNTLSWLQENPSFDALCARFPEAWRVVEAGVDDLIARGDMAEIAAVAARSAKAPSGLGVSGARGSRQHDAVLAEVERRAAVRCIFPGEKRQQRVQMVVPQPGLRAGKAAPQRHRDVHLADAAPV